MNRLIIKNCSKQLGKYNLIKSKEFLNDLHNRNTNSMMKLHYNYTDSKREYNALGFNTKTSCKDVKQLLNNQKQQKQQNYQNKDQKSNPYNKSLLSKIFAILFLVNIYQNTSDYNIAHCDYDIDDMMLTIQLDERIFTEQQQNQKQKDEQQKNKDPQKQKEKRKKKVKLARWKKSNSNKSGQDQRYGTPQEMVRDQTYGGDDFQSVEERIKILAKGQSARNGGKQEKEESKDSKLEEANNSEGIKQDLANFVFENDVIRQRKIDKSQTKSNEIPQQNQQQKIQKPQFDYSKKPAVIIETPNDGQDDPPMTQAQQKIQNDNNLNQYQKTLKFMAQFGDDQLKPDKDEDDDLFDKQLENKRKQKTDIFKLDELKSKHSRLPPITVDEENSNNATGKDKDNQNEEVKVDEKERIGLPNISDQKVQNQTKQTPKQSEQKPQTISSQNSAIISIPSPSFFPLAMRIQNFLKVRGIKQIHHQKQKQMQKQQKSMNQTQRLSLHLCNKISQCKEIEFKNQSEQTRDVFHHINNFINPPHVIQTLDEAKQLLKLIQADQYIVGTYIPKPSSQQPTTSSPSIFNTFSLNHPQPSPQQAQTQFNQYKYLSSTKKNNFVIIRNKQVANYLKISNSNNKIGVPHILYKYDREFNGKLSEPNCKIENQYYHLVGNFDKIINSEKLNSVEKVAHKINQLTDKGFSNVNTPEDIYDRVRHLRELNSGFKFVQKDNDLQKDQKHNMNKKLLVVKINNQKQADNQEINKILEKLSKICRRQVSIIKTQSQAVLKSNQFKIISGDEYGTVRLFDLNNGQEPLVKEQKKMDQEKNNFSPFFNRFQLSGPFQIENLARWINNLQPNSQKVHNEEDCQINHIKASYPGDFQIKNNRTNSQSNQTVKLVLFYKDGCKGCKMMQQLIDKIQQLKHCLSQQSPSPISSQKLTKQICLHYRIQNPSIFTHLNISKYNILNQDEDITVTQTTPTLYLFNEGNSKKVQLKTDHIFNHLNKINLNNGQKIKDEMIRDLIQEMQRNYKKFQEVI